MFGYRDAEPEMRDPVLSGCRSGNGSNFGSMTSAVTSDKVD